MANTGTHTLRSGAVRNTAAAEKTRRANSRFIIRHAFIWLTPALTLLCLTVIAEHLRNNPKAELPAEEVQATPSLDAAVESAVRFSQSRNTADAKMAISTLEAIDDWSTVDSVLSNTSPLRDAEHYRANAGPISADILELIMLVVDSNIPLDVAGDTKRQFHNWLLLPGQPIEVKSIANRLPPPIMQKAKALTEPKQFDLLTAANHASRFYISESGEITKAKSETLFALNSIREWSSPMALHTSLDKQEFDLEVYRGHGTNKSHELFWLVKFVFEHKDEIPPATTTSLRNWLQLEEQPISIRLLAKPLLPHNPFEEPPTESNSRVEEACNDWRLGFTDSAAETLIGISETEWTNEPADSIFRKTPNGGHLTTLEQIYRQILKSNKEHKEKVKCILGIQTWLLELHRQKGGTVFRRAEERLHEVAFHETHPVKPIEEWKPERHLEDAIAEAVKGNFEAAAECVEAIEDWSTITAPFRSPPIEMDSDLFVDITMVIEAVSFNYDDMDSSAIENFRSWLDREDQDILKGVSIKLKNRTKK